ncbi:MAG: two-component system sensor histidine kinase NtrB [Candidatus Eutrophobiaceae bacterium]
MEESNSSPLLTVPIGAQTAILGSANPNYRRAVRYFCNYRLFISILLLGLYWLNQEVHLLNFAQPTVYIATLAVYLAASIVANLAARLCRERLALLVWMQIFLDVSCLSIFIYSSEGLSSGLGMLLLVAVSGLGVLSGLRMAIFSASLASLAILGGEVYVELTQQYAVSANYTHAGFLGMSFFLGALLLQRVAAQAERGERLASQHAHALRDLSRLNEHIVSGMYIGVIVIDDGEEVRLCNEAAQYMIAAENVRGRKLGEISSVLQDRVQAWRARREEKRNFILSLPESGMEVRLEFVQLPTTSSFATLIFMEDASSFKLQLQQMKLASLGRLTASIAHEVRNPLGAIGHAGQLLCESEQLSTEDLSLAKIVVDQSQRMNRVIENVLSLSRGQIGKTGIKQDLGLWLRGMVRELIESGKAAAHDLQIDAEEGAFWVFMDSSQIHQVVWNLVDNALRHSKRSPKVSLACRFSNDGRHALLDVRDQGCGVAPQLRKCLFDPFLTTESQGGVGLGLYIAKELCEANQASLFLFESDSSGSCFRISFKRV